MNTPPWLDPRSGCEHARRVKRARTLLFILFAACTATPKPAWDLPAAERVIAIGDVHGSFENLTAILSHAGLIDEDLRWSGGNAVLVQTGDLMDRGRDVRRVLDLMIDLQTTAPATGGRVVVLWGNHEVINLTVDLFDVSTDALATFVDARSEERRRAALATWRASLAEPPGAETEAAWQARHPPGLFAYVDALGPEGTYGQWLRQQPMVARVGDTLFVHGGIHTDYVGLDPGTLNERGHDAVARIDRHRRFLIRNHLLLPTTPREDAVDYATRAFAALSPERQRRVAERMEKTLTELRALTEGGFLFDENTPLWFRGFATLPDEQLDYLPAYLDSLGVRRVVVGHMPQAAGEIATRLGGRVLLIDTAMQSLVHERGRPAALEIEGGRISAIYEDDKRVLVGGE